MRSETPQLDEFVAPLLGQPAWGAKQGYGSFLSLEFGSPKLIIKEWRSRARGQRRQAFVQGEWHVWIYCCEWRFLMHGEQIAYSEDARDDISRATAMLDGQKLVRIAARPTEGLASFHFDLGGVLETWPVGDDPSEEQWFIYGPDEVFGYRADGHFTKNPPDAPRSEERWSRLG